MRISPFVIGSGRAAQALERSLLVLGSSRSAHSFAPLVHLKRGQSLEGVSRGTEHPLLFIANPHGLHTETLMEADRSRSFEFIVCEKPVSVSLLEVERLRNAQIITPVAICHVYRQMWGIQHLRRMIDAGELGEVFAIEGRYWQSSTAQKALLAAPASPGWKDDPRLGGRHDVLIDLATHWADAALFLLNQRAPAQTTLWLSHANAESAHRDSHVHLSMTLPGGTRTLASISKTVHGAGNHFEINVLGTRRSATWNFSRPDEIEIGEGAGRHIIARSESERGSGQAPFHGMGWIEGYIEILRQVVEEWSGGRGSYPRLDEQLDMLEALLRAATPF